MAEKAESYQIPGDLKMTPQEQFLYQIHLNNLRNPVVNPDGSVSTLLQTSFEHDDGRTYNVPTVWEGAKHKPEDAIARALKIGLEKYPSYKSEDEAEKRYEEMHKYMERDLMGKREPDLQKNYDLIGEILKSLVM